MVAPSPLPSLLASVLIVRAVGTHMGLCLDNDAEAKAWGEENSVANVQSCASGVSTGVFTPGYGLCAPGGAAGVACPVTCGLCTAGCCRDSTRPSCVACLENMTLAKFCSSCLYGNNAAVACSSCHAASFQMLQHSEETVLPWIDPEINNGTEIPPGSVSNISSDLDLPRDTYYSSEQWVAMRFAVDIDSSSLLAAAHVQFTSKPPDPLDPVEQLATTQDVTLSIHSEASIEATVLSDDDYDVTTRHFTQNDQVLWSPPVWAPDTAGDAQRTPNVARLLQPLVWQPDWWRTNANSVVLMIHRHASTAGATGTRIAHAMENTTLSPRLDIIYVSDDAQHLPTAASAVVATAEEAVLSGVVRTDSTDLDLPRADDAGEQLVALQLRIQIPADREVMYAALQLTSFVSGSGALSLHIAGEGNDSPAQFTASSRDISSRRRTSTVVEWQVPDWTAAGQNNMRTQTPDLSPIIREWRRYQQAGGQYGATYWPSTNTYDLIVYRDPADNTTNTRRAVSQESTVSLSMVTRTTDAVVPATTPLPSPSPSPSVSYQTGADQIVWASDAAEELLPILHSTQTSSEADAGSAGQVYTDSSDLELGAEIISTADIDAGYTGHDQVVAIRFDNISVAVGETIMHAYIQFRTADPSLGAVTLRIMAERSGESPAALVGGATADVSSRHRTSSYVEWSPPEWGLIDLADDAQRTVDIAPVLNEVISQSGWTAGNDILLLILRSPNHQEDFSGDTVTSYRSASSLSADDPLSGPCLCLYINHTVGPIAAPSDHTQVAQRSSEYGEEPVSGLYMGYVYTQSSDIELPRDVDYDVDQMVALRFTDLPIPASARITEAHVQFEARDHTDDAGADVPPTLVIAAAADVDPAGSFDYPAAALSARDRTAASMEWLVPPWLAAGDHGAAQRTPDLSAVVQEVVWQPDWAAEREVVLLLERSPATAGNVTDTRVAHSGEFGGAPLLTIRYDDVNQHVAAFAYTEAVEEYTSGQWAGNVYDVSTDLEFFFDETYGADQIVALRFPLIDVPTGAAVEHASIQFTAKDSPGSGDVGIAISIEASANAAAFNASDNFTADVSARPYAADPVVWRPREWSAYERNSRTRTPDLAGLLQQAVDMADWQRDNAIVFKLEPVGGQLGPNGPSRLAWTDVGYFGYGPRLHVVYRIPDELVPSPTASPSALPSPSPSAPLVVEMALVADVERSELTNVALTVMADVVWAKLGAKVPSAVSSQLLPAAVVASGAPGAAKQQDWTRVPFRIIVSQPIGMAELVGQMVDADGTHGTLIHELNSAWAAQLVVAVTITDLVATSMDGVVVRPPSMITPSVAPSSSADVTPLSTASPAPTDQYTPTPAPTSNAGSNEGGLNVAIAIGAGGTVAALAGAFVIFSKRTRGGGAAGKLGSRARAPYERDEDDEDEFTNGTEIAQRAFGL